jgi:hypothetical protein
VATCVAAMSWVCHIVLQYYIFQAYRCDKLLAIGGLVVGLACLGISHVLQFEVEEIAKAVAVLYCFRMMSVVLYLYIAR